MFRLIIVSSLVVTCLAGISFERRYRPLPLPSVKTHEKIVGGEETAQVPYLVVVRFFELYTCGGSILRSDVIITAAHCAAASYLPGFYSVRAGSSIYNSGGQVARVYRIIKHPDYDGHDYDVALFKLWNSLTLGENIAPIKLPLQDQEIEDGTEAVTYGWGRTGEDESTSKVIRTVVLPIVNQETCEESYESAGFNVTDVEICAGDFETGGIDACYGDSGGPLVIDGLLIGITSWGNGCARPKFPGVWARVPAFVDWIESNLS